MDNSVYLLIWYFLIYSFGGWCMEITYAAIREKRFLNRGVLNGPICPIYGLGMVFVHLFLGNTVDNFLFLVLGCGIVATILEFFTGGLMERLFKKRWWDYSDYKYNLGGYVCLPFSALWGFGAACILRFVHPSLSSLVSRIPIIPGRIILIVAVSIFAIDIISVAGIIFEVQKYNQRVEELAEGMQQISNRIGRAIFVHIQNRMTKAHPVLVSKKENLPDAAVSTVFAWGCSFHKLIWLFFISALLGDITETIFCYIKMGRWMSRSSVVYGPFSIVWGLGVVVLTIMLHKYKDWPDRYIFLFGTVVGGAYEYICSVFTELVFGTVFWDYSDIPFNLGGRINLLYCFFWGLAAVVWIKIIYPILSGLIERVPMKMGKMISGITIVFMTFNIILSGLALARYTGRYIGIEPDNAVDIFLDSKFPDERIERIYPNIIMTE